MFETAKATDQHRVLSGGLLHSKETTSSPTEQLLYTVCVYAYIGAESLRLKVELRGGRIGQLWCEAEVGKLHTSSQEEHCGRRRRCRSKAWSVKTIHVKQIQWTEKWLFSWATWTFIDIQEACLKHVSYMRYEVRWPSIPSTEENSKSQSRHSTKTQRFNLHAKKWRVSATAVDRGMKGVAPSTHFRHVLKLAFLSPDCLMSTSDPARVSLLEVLGVWNGSFTLMSYK